MSKVELKPISFKTVPEGKTELLPTKRRPSRYLGLVEAMKGLTKGKELTLDVPSGSTVKKLAVNVTSVIANFKIPAPAGMRFARRIGVGNTLVIQLAPKLKTRK